MIQLSLFTRPWLDEAESALLASFPPGSKFSSDDVHRVVSAPQEKNWLGVLMARLRCKGRIARVGSVASKRPESNCRHVGVFEVR